MRLRREAAFGLIFLLAAVVVTWPLARVLSTGVSDLGDPLLNVWIIDWVQHALLHQPSHLFDAPVFHPAKYPLAYSENMLGIAVLMLPFRAMGLAPITLFNVAMLLGFATAGYAASVLARTVGASTFAAVITGIGYAFGQFFFDHLPHIQIIWSGWLPLILASLIYFWRAPTWRSAALAAAAFLGNALTNIYFMLFAALAVALTLLFLLMAAPPRTVREWVRLIVAFAVAGVLLYPVLAPYRAVSQLYDMKRGPGEVSSGSATWIDWMTSSGRSAIYGRVEPPGDHGERRLFPGIVPIVMTVIALLLTPFVPRETAARDKPSRLIFAVEALLIAYLVAWLALLATHRRIEVSVSGFRILAFDQIPTFLAFIVAFAVRCSIRVPRFLTRGNDRALRDSVSASRFSYGHWAAALWIVLGVVGSFGSNSILHMWLYENVYVFKSLRAVGRWGVIAYVGLVPWSAAGIDVLIARWTRWRRLAIAALIVLLAAGDVATRLRWENAPIDAAPVHHWIASEKLRGPFLELPMEGNNVEYMYLLGSMVHRQMLMNGTSGFEPPLHMTLRDMTNRQEFNDVLQSLLENNGCRFVIIHGDEIGRRDVVTQWLYWGITSGKLGLMRRFDHGVEGDFLLAITKNAPEWKRYERLPDHEKLGRYLNHLPVRNESLFGALEKPAMMSTVFKRLEVSGWALSPNGIRRVDVEVGSRKETYVAQMVPRPDVSARYPWYGSAPSGFRLIVPKRPKGLPRETDVQVIVTDGAGKVLRLRDVLITWH
jgi:hypothetical protein